MKEMDLYPEIKKSLLQLTQAVFKIPGSTYNQGLPDYILVHEKRPVHIEVKLDRPGKPSNGSELQKEHLRKVNEAGGIGFFLHYFQDVKQWEIRGWMDDPSNVFGRCERRLLTKFIQHHINVSIGRSV